jgi:hypothetical protein
MRKRKKEMGENQCEKTRKGGTRIQAICLRTTGCIKLENLPLAISAFAQPILAALLTLSELIVTSIFLQDERSIEQELEHSKKTNEIETPPYTAERIRIVPS